MRGVGGVATQLTHPSQVPGRKKIHDSENTMYLTCVYPYAPGMGEGICLLIKDVLLYLH
jgi:hypothetical protein